LGSHGFAAKIGRISVSFGIFAHRGLLLRSSVFGAAALLFAIEPMLAKRLLPELGGSPATWAACMVAFQLLLLAGYGYAHLGARYLDVRRQALLHVLLLALGAMSVLALPPGRAPDLGALPPALAVPWLVLRRVGLPFVMLASTAPLLSRWAPLLGRPSQGLYAVSNAGALGGLLAYPVLERVVGLSAQLLLWAAGFVLFSLCIGPVCLLTARAPSTVSSSSSARAERSGASFKTGLAWLGWAAVPSAMLLAVTNYITVDVAATPVLWILPLAVYLVSFVVAFSSWNDALRGVSLAIWVLGACSVALSTLGQGAVPFFTQLGSALTALLGACLLCHGELARSEPEATGKTGFYLLMASGGVVGGAVVSLLAPLVFSDFYELELSCAAAFLLLLGASRRSGQSGFSRSARLVLYLGCGLCGPMLLGEVWLRHAGSTREGRVVERRRSFLGPLRVVDVARGRVLTHGRIQHGMQLRAPAQATATMYFARGTAVAHVLDDSPTAGPRRLGVVGLGIGTLATYGRRGDSLRFYELDPNVIELASKDFTFLAGSSASVTIAEGDGRLALSREPVHGFDVLVIDAFSSDAVPVHLLTREAFEVYRHQLGPNGVLLANVSNRHLAVERVVRASASAVGLSCVVVESWGDGLGSGVHAVWAVMTRDAAALAQLTATLPLKPPNGADVLWTDNRASVLSVLR
jgi:spermidine synthase